MGLAQPPPLALPGKEQQVSDVGILLQISMLVLSTSATNCVTTTSTNSPRPTPRSSPVRTRLPCAPCLMSLAAHQWRMNLEVGC